MKLSDLKPARYNARKISDKAFAGLGYSIEEFGDLSGITINTRTGNLVCGHQRCKAIAAKYGDVEIIDINNDHMKDCKAIITPDWIFHVRQVDWPLEKEKAANIAANNQRIAGTFIADELDSMLAEIQEDNEPLFEALNFNTLLEDIGNGEFDDERPEEPEPQQEPTTDGDWVKFQVGDIKGQIFKDVYTIFLSEWERLSGIVESEKITPILEALVANSANTPTESIK
jgi:hypothetical protein